jgi:perosamine synthetase
VTVKNSPIPLFRPVVTEADVQSVLEVLRSSRLSLGPRVRAFEAAVAERAGRKFGVAVNSATSGLHLCVKALGIGEGDEVLTTPFALAATNCPLFERARPVFVDIDPASGNIDPAALRAAITPRTRAILPVEAFGCMMHFDEYERIARQHNLRMIEGCCHALGGAMGGRPAGSFGDCGVFSFGPGCQVDTGEGAVIVTDSEEFADLCRSFCDQGREDVEGALHVRMGYNYRLSDVNAALGEQQLNRLDALLDGRRRVAGLYHRELAGLKGIALPAMAGPSSQATASWFAYVIRLTDGLGPGGRDAVVDRLRRDGVECSADFLPNHLQPYARKLLGGREGLLPAAERLAGQMISLPFFADMTEEHVQRVSASLASGLGSLPLEGPSRRSAKGL